MRRKLRSLVMDFAVQVAKLSNCVRHQNACVLTSQDGEQIYAYGYNGAYRGGPNHCTGPNEPGLCECLHAEINALIKSRPAGPFAAFVTTAPCQACARALINAGVTEVLYHESYRNDTGLRELLACEVKVIFL